MEMMLPEMKVDVEGDSVVVRVWVSGISEKDIELEVSENLLKIDISKDISEKKQDKGFSSVEWRRSSFGGEISLPVKVEPMLIHHSYDGKVLEVRLKKLV